MKPFKKSPSLLCAILLLTPLLAASVSDVAPETYVVDKKESVVKYKCAMQFVPQNSHTGFVNLDKGKLTFENGQLTGGTIEVDMTTITDEKHGSDNDLIEHLKSEDFFDVKKYPISAIMITKVEKSNVTGNLIIKGIVREVTFPVKMDVKGNVVTATAKLTFDRSKWDVRYGSGTFFTNLANETISDNIELDVTVVAKKQ